MTYRELMEEVIHLGFDSAVDNLGALCGATNLAVAQLRRELCPATGRFTLTARKPIGYKQDEKVFADGGEEGICHPSGVAISFESIGSATVCFEANGEIFRTEQIASPVWTARKFVFPAKRGAKVVLKEAEGLSVRNVAVFDGVDSLAVNALPLICDTIAKYDVSAYVDDFLGMDDAPYTEMGVAVRAYEIYGNTLTLPVGVGRVEVTYRRKLRKAMLEDFSDGSVAVPDVPPEYADMLPLCVASYVWADLEPEKAAYYKQMYNEQLQYAKLQQKHRGKCRVSDRKGWR